VPLPRAILLDFDGTLVDSEPLHHRCWAEAVRPWGVRTDWEDYRRRFVGITDREAGRILLSEAGHQATAELVSAACKRKHQLYRSRCAEELSISSETVAIIRDLALFLPIGVVSSSITLEIGPVLRKANLNGHIRVVVCGDHVERHKPDPEPYLLGLKLLKENLDSIEAHDCLVFEDSEAGAIAATAAGMRVSRVQHPSELAGLLRMEAGGVFEGGAGGGAK
jgi:HAD superfamily hydrolase (TIGR01509 family)